MTHLPARFEGGRPTMLRRCGAGGTVGLLFALAISSAARGSDQRVPPPLYPSEGVFRTSGGDFYAPLKALSPPPFEMPRLYPPPDGLAHFGAMVGLTSFQEPAAEQPVPEQPLPEQPLPEQPLPQPTPDGAVGDGASLFAPGGFGEAVEALAAYESAVGTTPVAELVTPGTVPSTSLGELISRSETAQTVFVQRRSPVSFDPRVRGYRDGQVYTFGLGGNWIAARPDLDTVLSKIDPSIIDDVVIIPGPYGLRYGPAMSFLDVIAQPTPRYDCCQAHLRLGADYNPNGDQWFGRSTAFGGGPNYGYRFTYGHRVGSDFRSGNNTEIPASYNNRNVLGEIGYDINPYQHVNFNYVRLDQTDVEYPLQVYDTTFLVTEGFNGNIVDEDPVGPWSRLVIGGWYNRTEYAGNNQSSAKDATVNARVEQALANVGIPDTDFFSATNGGVTSTGGRGAVTFGDEDYIRLTVGGDFRLIDQGIVENSAVTSTDPVSEAIIEAAGLASFTTNMPDARMMDTGGFGEITLPITDWWTATLGGRFDFAHTNANANQVRTVFIFGVPFTNLPKDELNQDDVLYAFYLNNEIAVAGDMVATVGFGQAQRVPTLVERYSDALFLGIIQSGFTRTTGDPNLDKERGWQLDVGLRNETENSSYGVNLFYAWINDYVTLRDNIVPDPLGARVLKYINTDLATLAGGSAHGQVDLAPRLSAFANMAYTEGRDQIIHAPLFQIAPLQGRSGLRLHDFSGGDVWGLEFGARMVDVQDRLGTIRQGLSGAVTTIELVTPGFTVWDLTGYYQSSENLRFTAGILNLFDRNYLEHLSLRFEAFDNLPFVANFSPGFSPYATVEWIY